MASLDTLKSFFDDQQKPTVKYLSDIGLPKESRTHPGFEGIYIEVSR